jgi:hypothetical protein
MMKKRLVSGLTAVCMMILLVSGVYAEGKKRLFVFKHDQKEIIVYGDVDEQKAKTISDSISDGEVSTRGNFFCLFGHNLARMTVWETTHCYYATAPRCLQKKYDVTYCTRSGCGYTVWTKIGENRISCCK